MPDVLTNIISVAVVLGIMILIHEWGHFVVAKAFGVRVDVFSIGFGPRLWGRKRGHTDYRISGLPLGGYVKMAGDNPGEERSGAPDEFLSKPRWQRVLVVVAGPAMNLVLAVLLIAGLFVVGMPQRAYVDDPVEIAGVLKDSPAEKAGIRVGDRVVELNGTADPTWDDALFELLFTPPGRDISVVVERKGQRLPLTVKGTTVRGGDDEFLLLGFPIEPVIVGRVTPEMPAERAGLRPDDQILSLNGQPVLNRLQFAAMIQDLEGQPGNLEVLRCSAGLQAGKCSGEENLHLPIRATYGDPGDGQKRWQIGIGFGQRTVHKAYPPLDAGRRAVWFNVRMTYQILAVVGQLFTMKVSIKQLEGPVGIARQSGQAAKQGIIPFVFLMAIISLNLGILNLLPIPILDGGHVLLLAIEGALRRDLSVTVKERFVQVGLVFLLLVFATVMYNDIRKFWPGH